jgi:hypothetical protein
LFCVAAALVFYERVRQLRTRGKLEIAISWLD